LEDLSPFATVIMQHKYSHTLPDGTKETWRQIVDRVVNTVVEPYLPDLTNYLKKIMYERKFIPAGRYLYAAGRRVHQVNNCLLLESEDSREGWAELLYKATTSLMTGAGIGVDYSNLRQSGSLVKGMGGTSTGPLALMEIVNEAGRHIMQGGSRRSAMWAGLLWSHPDIFKFRKMKDWSEDLRALKEKDFNFPAPLDSTNISVILDDEFFEAFEDEDHAFHDLATTIYWKTVKRMCKTGEPGFSINYGSREHLRNACTEVTSADDSDVCNLGSINFGKVESISELCGIVEAATAFLLCGSLYSTVPYERAGLMRDENRRLGLGIMGLHEWLLRRDYRYEENEELTTWLQVYEQSTNWAADYADALEIRIPIATRAIAPAGTISIIGETTSGIEPVFCTSFKRRYLKGNSWYAQYVIDSAAQRLIERGVNPTQIEDAYSLALDVERRIAFQAYIQGFVDMAISSTINLPSWGSEHNNQDTVENFGKILARYLPLLRGITTYPDGARGGQPLTPVPYHEAKDWVGVEWEENGNQQSCMNGVCGV